MYQNHTQHQHQSVSLVLISVFCVAVLIYTCGLVALTGIFQLKIEASENLTVQQNLALQAVTRTRLKPVIYIMCAVLLKTHYSYKGSARLLSYFHCHVSMYIAETFKPQICVNNNQTLVQEQRKPNTSPLQGPTSHLSLSITIYA